MATSRYNRTKKMAIPRVPRRNPVEFGNQLAREHGLERAVALAEECAAGGRAALERVEGREIMDYMSPDEVKKSVGLWSTIAGYLRKKLPNGGKR
jgi:hypothetical protein